MGHQHSPFRHPGTCLLTLMHRSQISVHLMRARARVYTAVKYNSIIISVMQMFAVYELKKHPPWSYTHTRLCI